MLQAGCGLLIWTSGCKVAQTLTLRLGVQLLQLRVQPRLHLQVQRLQVLLMQGDFAEMATRAYLLPPLLQG